MIHLSVVETGQPQKQTLWLEQIRELSCIRVQKKMQWARQVSRERGEGFRNALWMTCFSWEMGKLDEGREG